MPSDAKKRQAAKKKEDAKNRLKKKPQQKNQDDETEEGGSVNGDTNGSFIMETGRGEVNGAVLRAAENEKGENDTDGDDMGSTCPGTPLENPDTESDIDEACAKLREVELANAQARSCTGVLASHPQSRDLKVDSFSVTFYGVELVQDAKLELNNGRRYGLIGLNGSGKSTLLQAIANREIPIPDHFDIYLLSREMSASEKTALQAVVDVDQERIRLEREAEELASYPEDEDCHERLMDIYDRLEDMDAATAEATAAELLFGLGFNHSMMMKKCKEFSGGWRMRIALARALFLKPTVLLLDEPTNHLDLDACVWLEEELKNYKRVLVIVSHSQDFLNSVCTNTIHLVKQKLKYYGGNYDAFVRTRVELLENQMKQYNWEQDQLKHMKDYVARFGHGSAKLARQAQSKEKTMAKMVAGGLTEKVVQESVKSFYFIEPGYVPPPVIMVQHVSFKYGEGLPTIFSNLDFGIDLDTRVALVGPNGAGKSTLLKLLVGEIMPTDGLIRRHSHVKLGRYHQHLHEELPLELSALEYMQESFPDIAEKEHMRKIVGRYGLTGRQQTCPMKQLSDGQRCRVSFAWLAWQRPHLLLLDEPTNHLDMESIDALAEAINTFEGGMILVSHDFRLVKQVAEEIWVCDKRKVGKWEGDIFTYKEHLRKQIAKKKKAKK